MSVYLLFLIGNLIVSGDNNGLIQYCDETFREVKKIPDAHAGPIRGDLIS